MRRWSPRGCRRGRYGIVPCLEMCIKEAVEVVVIEVVEGVAGLVMRWSPRRCT